MEEGTFFKSAEDTGETCRLMLKDRSLYIYLASGPLIIWRLDKTIHCQKQEGKLNLTKTTGKVERLEYEGPLTGDILAAWQLPEEIRTEGRRPLVSYTPFFISVTTILIIGLMAYFWLLPWLARQLVSLIPTRFETELGDALSRQYALQYKRNDSATYYANRFREQMRFNTTYPLHIEVLESEELNAFALPGGRIYIYSGMLKKLESAEELAALLGHEASHVIHRHSLKSILRSAASGLIISAVFGNFSELSAWVLSNADEFKQLDYSRELETEADDEGFKLLLENKIDPQGMLNLLKLLKKESAEMPGMMKYLSTHPETDNRIENVEGKKEIGDRFAPNTKLKILFAKIKGAV